MFASDLNKEIAAGAIGYVDILPISDQLSNLNGNKLDLILETPGGSGEVAEDIVRLLRAKYDDIAVIVPGWAKSAGTIMAMAANEILMGPASALGPIDAQLFQQGKRFSADALIEGMEKIKKEVTDTGALNRAYIPILQGISPGELQSAENALNFAKTIVTAWLCQYKFKDWKTHSSTGAAVMDDEKKARAKEIADHLCDHRFWLTHGRSIKIDDFAKMRLKVVDYSQQPQLADAIGRYFSLLQMTFATHIYKLYETQVPQIVKFNTPQNTAPPVPPIPQQSDSVLIGLKCNNCQTESRVQANFGKAQPLQPGAVAFPPNNKLTCPNCKAELDLTVMRRQLEAQTKKQIL